MSVVELRQIEALLRDQSSGLRDQIVRSLGNFTAPLFGIHKGAHERLEFAGTGTFVTCSGRQFILTAGHIWERVLRHADHIGLGLRADMNHRFSIERGSILRIGPPEPPDWNEWGPDLALLALPAEAIGQIHVYRAFRNLHYEYLAPPECLEIDVLMGTPAELGQFTEAHADLQITGLFVGPEIRQFHEGYDYYDFRVDLTAEAPREFGGVSGGGLWRVHVFKRPRGRPDWTMNLRGVAFFQFPIVNGQRILRCHGEESIQTLAAVLAAPSE